MQKRLKRRLKRTVTVIVAIYLMIGASLYFFQEKLLFLPTKLEQDYKRVLKSDFDIEFNKTNNTLFIFELLLFFN